MIDGAFLRTSFADAGGEVGGDGCGKIGPTVASVVVSSSTSNPYRHVLIAGVVGAKDTVVPDAFRKTAAEAGYNVISRTNRKWCGPSND